MSRAVQCAPPVGRPPRLGRRLPAVRSPPEAGGTRTPSAMRTPAAPGRDRQGPRATFIQAALGGSGEPTMHRDFRPLKPPPPSFRGQRGELRGVKAKVNGRSGSGPAPRGPAPARPGRVRSRPARAPPPPGLRVPYFLFPRTSLTDTPGWKGGELFLVTPAAAGRPSS